MVWKNTVGRENLAPTFHLFPFFFLFFFSLISIFLNPTCAVLITMRCFPFFTAVLASLAPYTTAAPRPASNHAPAALPPTESEIPRLVLYFQTTHDKLGRPISMLPLVTVKHIALTHLIVCSIHMHKDGLIHLNDHLPDHQRFNTLWAETNIMRQSGVKVMGMIGGAAAGSFTKDTLDSPNDLTFEHYYRQLATIIRNYQLQGLDIDVEQRMSQNGINRLILRLRHEFGEDFIITLAPVASALTSSYGGLSGFNYQLLEKEYGPLIDFYNTQFYNGFGSMHSTSHFDRTVAAGWDPAKIVIGQLTDRGIWEHIALNKTIVQLREKLGVIGGIMGWEYFNASPGGTEAPWEWARIMTEILRPGLVPEMKITRDAAIKLMKAWVESAWPGAAVLCGGVAGVVDEACASAAWRPTVDYMAMVNA
ncbi:glycoside hydrolase superfamily [Cercophora samala]|uniref:Glycoside hydrolase superfamily n=1 Tax=Cercophora samala TaxID=330535 RepID=A0AA40D5G2_9PEZI|nr:glycoside hydrolase superfamily [Cercophora samala]